MISRLLSVSLTRDSSLVSGDLVTSGRLSTLLTLGKLVIILLIAMSVAVAWLIKMAMRRLLPLLLLGLGRLRLFLRLG